MINVVSLPQTTSSAMPTRTAEQVDLEDRIAAAFSDGAESSSVATLIQETEAAVVEAEAKAQHCRQRALDPALRASDVAAARAEMADAAFRCDRLKTAVNKLRSRLRELHEDEEDQRRLAIYTDIKRERDALAAQLADVYPTIVEQLAPLLRRLQKNDEQVEIANRNLPRGSGRLLVAELIARGLEGFVQNGVATPSIVGDLRLPTFERSPFQPYAWPPPPPNPALSR